ncbi:MAG: hypothetical protein AVDCRST_MAG39-2527, partial [uncultured Sphingomonadaceae bacterium]
CFLPPFPRASARARRCSRWSTRTAAGPSPVSARPSCSRGAPPRATSRTSSTSCPCSTALFPALSIASPGPRSLPPPAAGSKRRWTASPPSAPCCCGSKPPPARSPARLTPTALPGPCSVNAPRSTSSRAPSAPGAHSAPPPRWCSTGARCARCSITPPTGSVSRPPLSHFLGATPSPSCWTPPRLPMAPSARCCSGPSSSSFSTAVCGACCAPAARLARRSRS